MLFVILHILCLESRHSNVLLGEHGRTVLVFVKKVDTSKASV